MKDLEKIASDPRFSVTEILSLGLGLAATGEWDPVTEVLIPIFNKKVNDSSKKLPIVNIVEQLVHFSESENTNIQDYVGTMATAYFQNSPKCVTAMKNHELIKNLIDCLEKLSNVPGKYSEQYVRYTASTALLEAHKKGYIGDLYWAKLRSNLLNVGREDEAREFEAQEYIKFIDSIAK